MMKMEETPMRLEIGGDKKRKMSDVSGGGRDGVGGKNRDDVELMELEPQIANLVVVLALFVALQRLM